MLCTNCGNQIDDDAVFCTKCGKKQDQTEATVMPDDKGATPKKSGGIYVATLLVVFLIIPVVAVGVVKVNIMRDNKPQAQAIPTGQEYTKKKEILDWYSSLDQVRAKTSDAVPASVVVQVSLGYNKDDKQASAEISYRRMEINAFLYQYFSELTKEDLKPQNEDILRQQIRDRINDDILSDSKIRNVQFTTLDVVEQ